MKFELLDRIEEVESGQRLVAVKAVSRAEEYLGDHFPTFPVLPGVMMLQALAEAGTWLVREAEDFASSVILLSDAKNVTYKSFVKPGNLLRVEVTCLERGPERSRFSGVGYCNQTEMVKARFGLRHFSLAERGASWSTVDDRLRQAARARFAALCSPASA